MKSRLRLRNNCLRPDIQVITTDIANNQSALPIDRQKIGRAVRAILEEESIPRAEISVAVVDDAAIRTLNRQYLNHDFPTDVLSFVLKRSPDYLEGEVIVSAQTAQAAAGQFGWSAANELLLYVIHGVLHLVGCRDGTAKERARMRSRERSTLSLFGLEPQYPETAEDPSDT